MATPVRVERLKQDAFNLLRELAPYRRTLTAAELQAVTLAARVFSALAEVGPEADRSAILLTTLSELRKVEAPEREKLRQLGQLLNETVTELDDWYDPHIRDVIEVVKVEGFPSTDLA